MLLERHKMADASSSKVAATPKERYKAGSVCLCLGGLFHGTH